MKAIIAAVGLSVISGAALAERSAQFGGWKAVVEESQKGGGDDFSAVLKSQSPIPSPRGSNFYALVELSCTDGETRVAFYFWGNFFVDHRMSYQIDYGDVRSAEMLSTLRGTSLELRGEDAADFQTELMQGDFLSISVESATNRIDSKFGLDGVEGVVSEVTRYCEM